MILHDVNVLQVYIQKKQLDSKMLSGLLTGVNRAFPFLKGKVLRLKCQHILA